MPLIFAMAFSPATYGEGAGAAAEPGTASREAEWTSVSIGMKLRLIHPGRFTMGSPATERDRSQDEFEHEVTLTKPFYMGVHEVTQVEFQDVMGFNPSEDDGDFEPGEYVPVSNVTWFDAAEFCNRLSRRDGLRPRYEFSSIIRDGFSMRWADVHLLEGDGYPDERERDGYLLPTEAQWEYACRAGTKTPFNFGISCDGSQANVAVQGTSQRAKAVGTYKPNGFGLHDMHGNLYEWCFDRYVEDLRGLPGNDPVNKNVGPARVVRGGCFASDPQNTRAAGRSYRTPSDGDSKTGFRVCRNARARAE